jgi:hypothetical protein
VLLKTFNIAKKVGQAILPRMKFSLVFAIFFLLGFSAVAQVDIEHRRTLEVQTGMAVYHSEEDLNGFGYFWFNEDRFPWTNTALRVIYAGVFLDTELSYYVAGNTNTAIGAGLDGGLYLGNVTPYVDGERLAQQTFDGDGFGGHVFINQTIPNPTPLPLNFRATYSVYKNFFRNSSTTKHFILPSDYYEQGGEIEMRWGGIEPGLLNKRGLELHVWADANYRSGFDAFGTTGTNAVVLGHKSDYQRVFGTLGARIPVGGVTPSARVFAGAGNNIDELSAWKLGGNLVNTEPYSYTLHGYYLKEFLVDRFVAANLALSVPVESKRKIAVHFYGDWAVARGVLPLATEYHNYFGTGAGVSFRGPWNSDVLLSYGYGFNALRNGDHGGHEVALGVEKEF